LLINPGETIGITGSNGVGKSTFLSLLSGFLQPTSGSISIDGTPISDFQIEFLRSKIGIVPQQGVIFEGTIMENMTLYREGEAAEQAMEIAAKLGLGEIVSKLPDGVDTYIGGSAAGSLSEGVKQKIIIVRSLVGNPRFIFFDDSNANFDIKNDKKLVDLINEMSGDRTMVIVSHRPSFLSICDRSYEIVNGSLQHYKHPNFAAEENLKPAKLVADGM